MQQRPPIASPDGHFASPSPQLESDRPDLAAIARWHRLTLLALVLGMFSDLAVVLTRVEDFDKAAPTALLLFLAASAFAVVVCIFRCLSAYQLARALRVLWPWLSAVLSIWGVLGFFITLNFNKKARQTLRKNGIRVGFWGASSRALAK